MTIDNMEANDQKILNGRSAAELHRLADNSVLASCRAFYQNLADEAETREAREWMNATIASLESDLGAVCSAIC